MHTKMNKYLSYVFFLTIICSCGEKYVAQNAPYGTIEQFPVIAHKSVVGEDTLITCNMDDVSDAYSLKVSDLASDFEIVQFEDKDNALVEERRLIAVSDNYIGIIGEADNYKLFDRKGRFVCNVGRVGEGPGEYTAICDAQIDEKNKKIYLLSFQAKNIFIYNLEGKYLSSIPLSCDLLPKGQMDVDFDKELVTITSLPFEGYDMPIVWIQDLNGNLIQKITLPYLNVVPDYSNEIQANMPIRDSIFSFYIQRAMPCQDTLYQYNKISNKIKPLFTVDLPENNEGRVPLHSFTEHPNFYVIEILEKKVINADGDYNTSNKSKIIIDKKTLKGGYFDLLVDQVGGIPYDTYLTFCRDGYFVLNLEPGNLQDLIKSAIKHQKALSIEDKEKLKAFQQKIADNNNENNYLFIGKWKTN